MDYRNIKERETSCQADILFFFIFIFMYDRH